jgi:hypothetical protein
MWVLIFFCCANPEHPTVEVLPSGLHIESVVGISNVQLSAADGHTLVYQKFPVPIKDIQIDFLWPKSGHYSVLMEGDTEEWAMALPVELSSQGFLYFGGVSGQAQSEFGDGEHVPITVVGDGQVQWVNKMTAWRGGNATLTIGDEKHARQMKPGEEWLLFSDIGLESKAIKGCLDEQCQTIVIEPTPMALEDARAQLTLSAWEMPATMDGDRDFVLPENQIWLPSLWWQQFLSHMGLGFRARDPWAPITFESVTLENNTDADLAVLVDTRIVNTEGKPDEIFRPRLREGTARDGRTRALLKVPAQSSAVASLPIYFDGSYAIGTGGLWTRELRVSALGQGGILHQETETLVVRRAQGWVSIGFLIALLSTGSGFILLLFRGRRWLSMSTSILTSIAMFAALETVTRLVVRVAGLSAAAILGPFSIFVSALPDQLVRFSVLGALIGLLPKPGVAGLMILVSWFLGGVMSGSLNLMGVMTILGEVFWLESILWCFGVTRQQSSKVLIPQWRFMGAIILFSVLSSACGYALHMVLYRLFYHPVYLGSVLLGPGCLYVALSAVVARRLMRALHQVQR